MRFALVNGVKTEAEKGLTGVCQGCAQPMTPVCGIKKAKHWRHKVDCECDRWWENETEWHRNWKNCFPKEWQEIRHRDSSSNEWHISDVRTNQGHFLEFQHSYLKPDERAARNSFYAEKLVWIVDGLARKSDWQRMEDCLKRSGQLFRDLNLFRLPADVENVSLFNDWSVCRVPVVFDFGTDRPLCCLLPKSSKGHFYVVPISRNEFVRLHNCEAISGRSFSDWISYFAMRIFACENPEAFAALQKSKEANQIQSLHSLPQTTRRYSPGFRMSDLNNLLRPRPAFRRRSRRL